MGKYFGIFLLLIFGELTGKALTVSDSTRISILTCAPGNELYSLFGHTAIRLQDPATNLDVVFNYGTFDFRTRHFYLKYAQGLLPYQLSVTTYQNFIDSYIYDNRSVYSQTLRLDFVGKQRFVDLLTENCKPENRTYLYNFLFDNCSTRVRDLLEKASGQQIKWHITDQHKSFWNLLDEYLYRIPWVQWGIHTILAQPGARIASPYQYMFLPDYLMEGLESATLHGNLLSAPVHILFEEDPHPISHPWYASPLFIFSLATLLIIGLLHYFPSVRIFNTTVFLLFLTTGLIGLLLVFLGGFTKHPMTAPNYNLIWANPFNLLILPALLRKNLSRVTRIYLSVYIFILLAGLPLWLFLQPAVPYASFPLLLLMLYLAFRLKQKNRPSPGRNPFSRKKS